MSKQQINRKCAELLYPDADEFETGTDEFLVCLVRVGFTAHIMNIYRGAHTDQLCDVVDALIPIHGIDGYEFGGDLSENGIRQAMINFVESCLGESDE